MEYDNQDERLGGWILTICILHLIGAAFTILISILSFTMKDLLAQYNITLPPTTLGISIVLSIIIFAGAALILRKSKLGIALYYVGILANLTYSATLNGFKISPIIGGLILPILMAILINRKKELFGFGSI